MAKPRKVPPSLSHWLWFCFSSTTALKMTTHRIRRISGDGERHQACAAARHVREPGDGAGLVDGHGDVRAGVIQRFVELKVSAQVVGLDGLVAKIGRCWFRSFRA